MPTKMGSRERKRSRSMNSLVFWNGRLPRKACIAIASGGLSLRCTKSFLSGASEWSLVPPC